IALRLLWNGYHALQLYDVSDVSTRQFTNDYGGLITGSPRMMAQTCDAVITVLPSAAELREVCFGWESLAKGFGEGGIVIDLGIVLRQEVVTRRFQSGLSLGMMHRNIELASKLAAALEIEAPMLAATRAAWGEAAAKLGSGADYTAVIRWLESLQPPAEPAAA